MLRHRSACQRPLLDHVLIIEADKILRNNVLLYRASSVVTKH